jgi:O-antigen biosynthesis protein
MSQFTRIAEKIRDALPPATWFWLRFQRAQLTRKLRRAAQEQSPVALAENPAGNLNVIVFDALVPMPDRDAGSARMAVILKALTELGKPAIISLSSLELPEYEESLRQEGIEVASWVDYRQVLKSRHFQVAVLSRSNVAGALLPSLKRIAPDIKIIFDTVDIAFVRLKREYQLTGDKRIAKAARRQKKLETHLARACDLVWCVTAQDQTALAAEVPSTQFEIVPTIHPLQNRGPGFAEREGLVFIGNFLHRPNTDAVHYFLRQICPLVRERIPEIKLFIVGDHAPPELQNYASDKITLTGYVADVDSIFHNCRSMIAPLRFGSGMKGKIGQALSYGLPVVTTSIGAEGMGLENGREVMIADDAREFAAALIRLYQDATLWQKLSDHGYNHIARHFTPEVVTETISHSIRSLASDRE